MTGSMPLKIKIMLLAILPMVMVTTLTTWLGSKGARLLSEQEIEIFEESLLVSKRRELKHYVEMAQASIRPVIEQAGSNPAAALLMYTSRPDISRITTIPGWFSRMNLSCSSLF